MVAGASQTQTAKKAVKRSHDGEMKRQTIDKNMLDFGEMAAMVADMAARDMAAPQLEDFGGEQIPECCQKQIRLLLDDQLNGDEGKTLKDCCSGIWSGFRRYGFRWYKFRLFRQVYAPNGLSEEESDENVVNSGRNDPELVFVNNVTGGDVIEYFD